MIAIIIVAVSVTATMLLALFKPKIRLRHFTLGLYWLAALAGAVILLSTGLVDARYVGERLIANDAINPLKILVLFISMTMLSVFLDELGFFRYLANIALKKASDSQLRLFLLLYALVSVLTVFTSNDIIILTFTPFICFFSKNARVNPMPYLIAEFVAANTWSMCLVIGNPTNIYLATASGIGFAEYFKVMILPTVLCGATSLCVLLLLFRRQLKQPLSHETDDVKITDKALLIIGIVHLAACTVLLAVSSYIGAEMWLIALCFAVSLALCSTVYKLVKKQKPTEMAACIKRAPWELIPFVLSMFVFVLTFSQYGITQKIGAFIGDAAPIWKYGTSSFVAANVINNIPMSVFYSEMLREISGLAMKEGIFAAIVGSNIGAFLTPIGALAGIMWSGILRAHDIKMDFLTFVKYGSVVAIPTLAAALGGLELIFLIL